LRWFSRNFAVATGTCRRKVISEKEVFPLQKELFGYNKNQGISYVPARRNKSNFQLLEVPPLLAKYRIKVQGCILLLIYETMKTIINQMTFRKFLFFLGIGVVLSLCGHWNSQARQSGSPVDVTGVAKITPVPGGFQVEFPNPVFLSEIVYQGNYQGTYEVFCPSPKDTSLEAYALIDSALVGNPDNPMLLDTKGLIHIKNDRLQDAIPLFERAVEITCEGPIYVLHLAYAQMLNGENEKALTTFEKVRSVLMTRTDLLSQNNKMMFDELEMRLGGPSF